MSKYISVADIAADMDVVERTVRYWIAQGYLTAEKVGGTHVITVKDYEKFKASYQKHKHRK